jgi:hypothetical protein
MPPVNVIDLCGEVAYFRHCRVLIDLLVFDFANAAPFLNASWQGQLMARVAGDSHGCGAFAWPASQPQSCCLSRSSQQP